MQNSKGHISAKHAPNSFPKTSLKSLFLRLSFSVEIILVSGYFVAQADSIYHYFGSGIWARREPEAKHSGQWWIPKPRGFLISCGWKIYSCCNSNNTTEDKNTTEDNKCKFLYSTEEFALLRVIAAILFSKGIRCTGQAQMSWISGDVGDDYYYCYVYILLTKREVKMAGYWPSSLSVFLWTETKSRSIKTQEENEANTQPSWTN